MTSRLREYRLLLTGLFVLPALLGLQALWYNACLLPVTELPKAEAVVVFTGEVGRVHAAVRLARTVGARYLLVSREQRLYTEGILKAEGGLPGVQLWVDDSQATTTDGNARFAAPQLRRLGVRQAFLVTSWYHMPRSLFLLKAYLLFSSTRVRPYPSDVPPAKPWREAVFQAEYFKFWGSLFRMALHAVGVDGWPPNASGLRTR